MGCTSAGPASSGVGLFCAPDVGLLGETDRRLLSGIVPGFGDKPSALQALQDGAHLDVYLTYQGKDVPVFYSFLIPVVDLPTSGTVAQATGLPGTTDLVLVTVLLNGGLIERTPVDNPGPLTSEDALFVFLPPLPGHRHGVDAAGDGDAAQAGVDELGLKNDPLDGCPAPALQRGAEEALQQRLRHREAAEAIEDVLDAVRSVLGQIGDWLNSSRSTLEIPATSQAPETDPRAPAIGARSVEEAPARLPLEPDDWEVQPGQRLEVFTCPELLTSCTAPQWLPEAMEPGPEPLPDVRSALLASWLVHAIQREPRRRTPGWHDAVSQWPGFDADRD